MTYDPVTLATKNELLQGASEMQALTAECYIEATKARSRDYAIAWQKAQATHHRGVVNLIAALKKGFGMTYDSWKLDNAEDEADRHARYRRVIWRCRDCGTTHMFEESNCRNCDSEDLEEEPLDDPL